MLYINQWGFIFVFICVCGWNDEFLVVFFGLGIYLSEDDVNVVSVFKIVKY